MQGCLENITSPRKEETANPSCAEAARKSRARKIRQHKQERQQRDRIDDGDDDGDGDDHDHDQDHDDDDLEAEGGGGGGGEVDDDALSNMTTMPMMQLLCGEEPGRQRRSLPRAKLLHFLQPWKVVSSEYALKLSGEFRA